MKRETTTDGERKPTFTSRFVKGRRQDALAEIEGWIADVRKGTSTRVSSQPPKNITEQKMLDTKLFEMSKQRYNFILHSKWQQKLFMEKQKQKTAVMKDLLKNVDLSKLNTSAVKRKNVRAINANLQNATEAEKENLGNKENGEQPPISNEITSKVVTFITEQSESKLYGQGAETSDDDNPINAVQSANATDGFPPIEITNSTVHNVVETKRVQAYILPLEGRWPVRDSRFLKLSEALCENYPKGSTYDFLKMPKIEGAIPSRSKRLLDSVIMTT